MTATSARTWLRMRRLTIQLKFDRYDRIDGDRSSIFNMRLEDGAQSGLSRCVIQSRREPDDFCTTTRSGRPLSLTNMRSVTLPSSPMRLESDG